MKAQLDVPKIPTERDPADLHTKPLPFDRIQDLCKLVGVECDQDVKTREVQCPSARCPRTRMRRAKELVLRQQVRQAVDALQHEVTCRLPKSRDASGISPSDGSVLCAANTRDCASRKGQAIGAAVDVQFDGQLHPQF